MSSEFQWHTQLLSLKEIITDPVTSAWGLFAPSVLFGRNVNRITDGRTTFKTAALNHLLRGGCCCWCCCLPSYAAPFREQLRKKRNLGMDPYTDLHTHMFCHPCAVCQEERELDSAEATGIAGPKHPTVARGPEEVEEHLANVRNQQMER